jgi:hypothetical protein
MKRADEVLLLSMARVTHRRRAVLCALAQRGKLLREEQPARAQCMLAILSRQPLYKSGRLVFDMAEVAEALRDGPPPAHLDDEVLAQIMRPVAATIDVSEVLAACRAVPENIDEKAVAFTSPASRWSRASWPQLERSDALFDLIVLGVVEMLGRLSSEPGQEPRTVISSA